MIDVIRLLPDSLANQIAAGEVVQRPASVVKELLENAIDAQAKHIDLFIKDSGKTLIQVVDDGIGMSETDARLSFERHATSKIKSQEDLFKIMTMGFRGEALASIAAVAQVELKTKRQSDTIGTLIRIEASQLKSQEKVATPVGTSIAVRNLFFNVPARRNFLKSNPIELKHIIDEFQRVALAFPEVGFTMFHNDTEVYNLAKSKLAQRIVGIFGKNYREHLIPCQEETPLVSVRGYVGKPEAAKKTRGEQFFFVNNRFIKHGYLHHALMSAFQELLPKDAFPFYVLFLEIAPEHIDINVHPTKTEIKFDDEKSIYAIVQASVRKALGSHNIGLDFSSQTFDFKIEDIAAEKYAPSTKYPKTENKLFKSPRETTRERSNLHNWESIFLGLSPKTSTDTFEQETNALFTEDRTYTKQEKTHENTENKTFQLHQRYIVAQVKAGLMIIDQHLAHQRILYDKFLALMQSQGNSCVSQQLLFPIRLSLSANDLSILEELETEMKHIGFIFDKEPDGIWLRGTPADVAQDQEKEILESFLEQIKNSAHALQHPSHEKIARIMAVRSAIKYGTKLSQTEIQTLIAQLFASSNPNYSPQGERIFQTLDMVSIGLMLAGNDT
ncbi:MAG: DNA mismatch repair endonuclease MutL [Raineya sp.]